MDLGDLDTKTVIAGLGILLTGGLGAFIVFAGSETFINPNSNVGDLVASATQGDVDGVINNLIGDETSTSNSTEESSSASELESNSISLADARMAALDFVGGGEIISSNESSLSAYAFEINILLPDGGEQTVFVANDGSVELK